MTLAGRRYHVRLFLIPHLDEGLPAEFPDFANPRLTVAYGAEILPYHMRLKGLSIMLSVQSIAQAFVSYRSFCFSPLGSIN